MAKLEETYSIDELSAWSRKPASFWRREINEGRLRAVQLGIDIRVLRGDLEKYLAANEKKGPDPRRHPNRNGRWCPNPQGRRHGKK